MKRRADRNDRNEYNCGDTARSTQHTAHSTQHAEPGCGFYALKLQGNFRIIGGESMSDVSFPPLI
jgi:hypothetical protein